MQHYKRHGLQEGRSPCGNKMPSCKFDAANYFKLYPDVKKSKYYGASPARAILHYRRHGLNEGRAVCKEPPKPLPGCKPPPKPPKPCKFNARKYAKKYKDLMKAYGFNSLKLQRHYKRHGLKEGRSPCGDKMPSCKFDANVYWRLNPDVKKSKYYGASPARAAKHYRKHGMKERRAVCGPVRGGGGHAASQLNKGGNGGHGGLKSSAPPGCTMRGGAGNIKHQNPSQGRAACAKACKSKANKNKSDNYLCTWGSVVLHTYPIRHCLIKGGAGNKKVDEPLTRYKCNVNCYKKFKGSKFCKFGNEITKCKAKNKIKCPGGPGTGHRL